MQTQAPAAPSTRVTLASYRVVQGHFLSAWVIAERTRTTVLDANLNATMEGRWLQAQAEETPTAALR